MQQGYGPPPSGYGPPHGGYYGGPPPKKGMNGCLLAALIGGGIIVVGFGGCIMLAAIGASHSPSTSTVTVTPSGATAAATSTDTTTAVASASAAAWPVCPARQKCVTQHKAECTFTNTKQVSPFCLLFKCTNDISCPDDPPHKHGHPLSDGPFDVAVKGSQLFNDYQENEVAADNRYKGKILLVMGDVSEIRKDFTGGVIIGLTTSNEFMPDDAYLAEGQNAASLRKGQTVGLACKGDGMTIGRPDLKDCEIIESMTGAW
jgi:hypothetical protein